LVTFHCADFLAIYTNKETNLWDVHRGTCLQTGSYLSKNTDKQPYWASTRLLFGGGGSDGSHFVSPLTKGKQITVHRIVDF